MASDKRGKSLSADENDRLRDVIRKKLLPKYDGNQSVAGPKVGMTQAGLSRILAGGGGSLATARAVGEDLGMTVAEVLGWEVHEGGKSDRPRFGDRPGWAAAEAEARRLYGDILPGFAFDRAADTSGGKPPAIINARAVYALAKWWFEAASAEERVAAERAEILAVKAAEDAATAAASHPRRLVDATTKKPGNRDA